MVKPLFIATGRFDPTDGEKWRKYIEWAKIPALTEIVSLDTKLCHRVVTDILDEDWPHIVNENFRLSYFNDLNHLLNRARGASRCNILGLYRNSDIHISHPPGDGQFSFLGYDLIEEATQISALTNCGGFPDVFDNNELNHVGLLGQFLRAQEVKKLLIEKHPKEPHANCELYAIWRMNECNCVN